MAGDLEAAPAVCAIGLGCYVYVGSADQRSRATSLASRSRSRSSPRASARPALVASRPANSGPGLRHAPTPRPANVSRILTSCLASGKWQVAKETEGADSPPGPALVVRPDARPSSRSVNAARAERLPHHPGTRKAPPISTGRRRLGRGRGICARGAELRFSSRVASRGW